jgi:hypothetical protein
MADLAQRLMGQAQMEVELAALGPGALSIALAPGSGLSPRWRSSPGTRRLGRRVRRW